MRTLAIATILVGSACLAAPASAAIYCFDGAGRPLGSGFDRETPNYQQIEWARRTGGYCRDYGRGRGIPSIDPPQYYQHDGYYNRRPRYYDYYRYNQPYWVR